MRRFKFLFLTEGDAGGGQGAAGGAPAGGDPAGGAPAGTSPVGGDPAGGAPAGGETSTYKAPATQEDLNRIVEARLAKDRKSRTPDAEIERLRGIERAQMSESDRIKAELEAERARATSASDELNATKGLLVRSAVLMAAQAAGAVDPAAVFALATADGLSTSLTVSEDGTVAGAKGVVEAVLAERGYLLPPAGGANGAATRVTSFDGGVRNTQNPGNPLQQAAEAEAKGDFKTAMAHKGQQIAAQFASAG